MELRDKAKLLFAWFNDHYEEMLGKKARCDIARGTPMEWKFVE